MRKAGWILATGHAALLAVAVGGLAVGRRHDAEYRALSSRVPRTTAEAHVLGLQRLSRRLVQGRPMAAPEAEAVRGGIEPREACGAYSGTLARLLQVEGYPVRIAQMLERPGDRGDALHILLEAEVDGRWVVLDPAFDLAFRRPDGRLASFADVAADWEGYRAQVPAGYDARYRYAGVRYTNWDKVPVLLPAARGVLRLFLGDGVETFSLRAHALDPWRVAGFAALALAGLLAITEGVLLLRRGRRATRPMALGAAAAVPALATARLRARG